jgi:hypothetical protein
VLSPAAAAIVAIGRSIRAAVERLDDPTERDEILAALRAEVFAERSAKPDDEDELRALAEDRVARLVARRPRRGGAR